MSGDQLFPFPEPSFLFVHDVYLYNMPLYVEVDERGKQRIGENIYSVPPVKGYLTAPNAQADQTGYMQRESIDAVLLLANDIEIDMGWVINCVDPQLPPHLAGTYDVQLTRPNISHNRVLLKRYRKQWERWPNNPSQSTEPELG